MVVIYSSRKKRKQNSIRFRVEYEFDDGRQKSTAMAMEDRFSNMPETIIHHIMSFLPTSRDTMALSMVSKTFSSAFRSLPIIDLDFDHYSYSSSSPLKPKVLFLDSMVNYLQSRQVIHLDKLRFAAGSDFYIVDMFRRFSNMIIETMVGFAIDRNVKELELDFQNCFYVPETLSLSLCLSLSLSLPPQLCFSKTIRVLKLIGISHPPQLPNQDLIISSPSMENLSIIDCRLIGSITLGCNDKLKRVKIRHRREIRVEGPTPCLEYFSCHYTSAIKCELDITGSTFPKLKHMEVNNYVISPYTWINKLSNFSGFRFLETLKLFGCCKLKEIKFHLEYLNDLELDSVDFTNVDIEAPNLVSLIYRSISDRPPEINISISSTYLKHLEFQGEHVPRRWVAQNFSEFHVLETLKLSGSRGLKEIKFHLEYLNALEMVSAALMKVEIEAPNLVSLTYKSVSNGPPEINISSSSTNLKHLHFQGEYVPQRWVANNFSEFHVLETLELHAYSPLNKVKFRLPCLKFLNLFLSDERSIKVKIIAPNLVSFIYKTNAYKLVAPSVTFTSNAKPDVVLNVLSRLEPRHFPNMMNFIAYFAYRCNTFTLRYMMPGNGALIYPKELRMFLVPLLYNLKHLKVELVELEQYSLDQLVDGLLWLAPHPNTLSFIVGSQVKSLKFYYKNENVENWQHDLEEVVLQNFKGKEMAILQKYFRKL